MLEGPAGAAGAAGATDYRLIGVRPTPAAPAVEPQNEHPAEPAPDTAASAAEPPPASAEAADSSAEAADGSQGPHQLALLSCVRTWRDRARGLSLRCLRPRPSCSYRQQTPR